MAGVGALSRSVFAIALFVPLALAGCGGAFAPASPAGTGALSSTIPSAPQWIEAGGVRFHRPHYAANRETASQIGPMLDHVPYLGGSVILNPKVYFTFWGFKKYGDPDHIRTLLLDYAKAMGGSGHNNIETQYYQTVSGSTNEYITNPANQFGGSWIDDAPVPKTPSDPQIAAETVKAVGHFGYDSNGVYFIVTPHGRSEANFPDHWCSYHNLIVHKKKNIVYVYFPYMPDGGTSCGAKSIKPPQGESAVDEGVTIMAGHELGEAITDPEPSTGWDGPGGEIADVCAFFNIANDPFGKRKFTMQEMVSDATQSCVQSYP